jgi:hypothetical protein
MVEPSDVRFEVWGLPKETLRIYTSNIGFKPDKWRNRGISWNFL